MIEAGPFPAQSADERNADQRRRLIQLSDELM